MIIGLVGGVGSGKSTVLNYLESNYNAYIIQSDHVAKEIMTPGYKAFEQISKAFPQVVSHERIDNEKLSQIVFSDKEKLKQLNSITHPGTVEEIICRIKKSDASIIVVESALLIGSGLEKYCDEIWFVYCEIEKRIKRLMRDRGYSRERAEGIIKNQPSDDEYNTHADEFIDNTYSREKTNEQIDLLLSMMPCSF
ncbi:MAG: dephospho-CoA kinase [Eubacterium sp.]